MRLPPFISLLIAVGRTGLPELVISGFIFRFAYVLHSAALAMLAAFIIWPGLANLHAFCVTRKRPPQDEEQL